MTTYEEIADWLARGGFEVIRDDDEIRNYIQETSSKEKLFKVDVRNTDLSFRVHSSETSEVIDIRTARYFSKQDTIAFSKLPPNRQEKFYTSIKRIVFPFGLNVVVFPKQYQIHFSKTIFLEGLTKQYFFDSMFDFLHALELTSIAYENLSGSNPPTNPANLT